MDCYGVEHAPQGQSWLCDVCALGEPFFFFITPRLLHHSTALQAGLDPFSHLSHFWRELMTCASRCFCPGLHMLLHLSVAPVDLQYVSQDLENAAPRVCYSLAKHFTLTHAKSAGIVPSVEIVTVIIVVVIFQHHHCCCCCCFCHHYHHRCCYYKTSTVATLTTLITVIGAIVVVLSSLQDPGCTKNQHVCCAQWWALL